MPDGRIKMGPRVATLRAFPIGIDAEGFAMAAASGDGHAAARITTDIPLITGR